MKLLQQIHCDRSDPFRLTGGVSADAPPFPHQAPTVGLQWFRALEARDSGEYRMVRGKVRRNRERLTVLGLNDNHNHDLGNLFKGCHDRPALALALCTISMSRLLQKRDATDDGACPPWHERLPPSL